MDKPNILIFMTDQQRGDTIPPFKKAKTPHLDKFCQEGITFSNAFTVSPHCCPSRATFFSGLYPSQHGVWNNVDVGNTLSKGLYDGVKLFSEDLKEAGYKLYYSGKWHVSHVESPLDRGFDVMNVPKPIHKTMFRHECPDGVEWNHYEGFTQRKDRLEGEIIRNGYPSFTLYGETEKPFNDQSVTNDAIEMLKTRPKDNIPWSQFIGTLGPHDPYFVPKEYLEMYDINDIDLSDSFCDKMQDKPALYRRTRDRFDQLTDQEQKEAIRHYLAFCTYEDALFGSVLETLEQTGEIENTLVLYISDHGDYMTDHGLWCKGLPCFKGAYHIPVVVRWPKGITNPGRITDAFISMADFAPTFLEAANIEANREFTGHSLMPYFQDKMPTEWPDATYTQSNGNELYGIQRSVMTKDWKYVYNGFDYDELYDLHNDPNEMNNVIDKAENADMLKQLCKRLWKFSHKTGDVAINPYILTSFASYGPGVLFEED